MQEIQLTIRAYLGIFFQLLYSFFMLFYLFHSLFYVFLCNHKQNVLKTSQRKTTVLQHNIKLFIPSKIFSSLLVFHAEVIASPFQQYMPNCTMNKKGKLFYQGHYWIFHVRLQLRESLFSTKNHNAIKENNFKHSVSKLQVLKQNQCFPQSKINRSFFLRIHEKVDIEVPN